jgi:hypothetical protein
MSKATVVETRKQHTGVGIIQSLNVGITTIGVEMVVAPNINVIRRGILNGSTTKLDIGSDGVSVVRNLSQSLTLPTIITRIIDILQMVFTNLIMTNVNRITYRPPMSSMVVGR